MNVGHSLSQDFVVVGISVQEFQDLHQTLDVPETKKPERNSADPHKRVSLIQRTVAETAGFMSVTFPGVFGSKRFLAEERRPSRKHAHVT